MLRVMSVVHTLICVIVVCKEPNTREESQIDIQAFYVLLTVHPGITLSK